MNSFPELTITLPKDILPEYKNLQALLSAVLVSNSPLELIDYAKQAQYLILANSHFKQISEIYQLSQEDDNTVNTYICKILRDYD